MGIVGGWVICGTPEIVQVTRLEANFSPWFLHARIKLLVFLAIFPFSGGTCSLSASVGSGGQQGCWGKGSPLSSAAKSTNPTQPHLSFTGVAPVGVVVPLSAALPLHLRGYARKQAPPKRSTMPSGGQKHLTFLCLTRGNPIDLDSLPSLRALPPPNDRIPLSTSQPLGVRPS